MAPVLLGGTLVFISKLHTIKHAKSMNARLLIVHGNPTLGSNCRTIAGNTIPPVADPVAASPIANPLLFEKYVLSKLTAGQKIKPLPSPQHKPWARNSCQYVFDRLAMNSPNTLRIEPVKKTARKYPASVRRPVKVPMKNRRKICTVPIQDMVDGDSWREIT
jgi:hypothetical protein